MPDERSIADELAKLVALRDNGVLSGEELDRQKAAVLAQRRPASQPQDSVAAEARAPVVQTTNGLAIASFVLSLLWIGGLGSLFAIVLALVGRARIRQSAGMQGGGGLAIAGLVIGVLGLVGAGAYIAAFALSTSTTVTREQVLAASCQADARSVEVGLEAYKAQNGTYPTLPTTWSASNYVENYSPLTTSDSGGGQWLRTAPGTSNYVIEYDESGHVWIEGRGTYDTSYNPSRDFDSNASACDVGSSSSTSEAGSGSVTAPVPKGSNGSPTADGSATLPLVTCPTTNAGSQSTPSPLPTTIALTVPKDLANQLAVYSDNAGMMQLIAPRGWECTASFGNDGTGGVDVYPAGGAIPGDTPFTPSPAEAVVGSETSGCVSCTYGQACPLFAAAAAAIQSQTGVSCAAYSLPSGESMEQISPSVVGFEDLPNVAGDGIPSGGPYPANGVMTYYPTTESGHDGSWLDTCTLPYNQSQLCTVALNAFVQMYGNE